MSSASTQLKITAPSVIVEATCQVVTFPSFDSDKYYYDLNGESFSVSDRVYISQI